jgi:hypothetical protein
VERGFVLEEPDGTLTALDEVWDDNQVGVEPIQPPARRTCRP